MIRKLFVVFFVLALAVPASAVVDIQGAGPIAVKLTIQPYTQIWFQDDAWGTPPAPGEPDIEFSPVSGTDYFRPIPSTVIGLYNATNAASGTAEDGWAINFFESNDGATIWMQSNANFSAIITTSGDLTGFATAATIPTWFTIAVTGYDPITALPDPNGFRLGAGWVADGVIPFASMGGYAGDGNAGGNDVVGPLAILFGGQDFYPIQDAFQMVSNNGSTLAMTAPAGPGTMKFLARCKRMGVADPADTYTATITPTFTVP